MHRSAIMRHPAVLTAALVLVALACGAPQRSAAVGVTTATSGYVAHGGLASGQPCYDDASCRSAFCEHPVAFCTAAGTCSDALACESGGEDYDARVCGCNGRTYMDSCDAREHRVSIAAEGACRP